ERGWSRRISIGAWTQADLRLFDERFETQRPALAALLRDSLRGEPAAIAAACLEGMAPVVEEALRAHAAGRLAQDPVNLAWYWAGLHSNRLGIVNVSEAILRYFMYRLHA